MPSLSLELNLARQLADARLAFQRGSRRPRQAENPGLCRRGSLTQSQEGFLDQRLDQPAVERRIGYLWIPLGRRMCRPVVVSTLGE